MPPEYNFILLTESDLQYKAGITQHACQVQLSAHSQTTQLMDLNLDSSHGLFNEGSHTLNHLTSRTQQHTFKLCATKMITLKEIQELRCGTILVTLHALSLSFSTNMGWIWEILKKIKKRKK
jgi:hypothetical protein